METRGRKWLWVFTGAAFLLELYGLYYAWPHIESFYNFVVELVLGIAAYISSIIAAIVALKVLVILKLLISLVLFLLKFALKAFIAVLPEATARFLIKLGLYSGLVKLYQKSQFIRERWHKITEAIARWWQKLWHSRIKTFWATVPRIQKVSVYIVGGPLIVLVAVGLWIYDWIRLLLIKKTGVLGLESLIRKAHEKELHTKVYRTAMDRFTRSSNEVKTRGIGEETP